MQILSFTTAKSLDQAHKSQCRTSDELSRQRRRGIPLDEVLGGLETRSAQTVRRR